MGDGKPISIRLDADLRAALEREARDTNRTLAGLVRHVLVEHVRTARATPGTAIPPGPERPGFPPGDR